MRPGGPPGSSAPLEHAPPHRPRCRRRLPPASQENACHCCRCAGRGALWPSPRCCGSGRCWRLSRTTTCAETTCCQVTAAAAGGLATSCPARRCPHARPRPRPSPCPCAEFGGSHRAYYAWRWPLLRRPLRRILVAADADWREEPDIRTLPAPGSSGAAVQVACEPFAFVQQATLAPAGPLLAFTEALEGGQGQVESRVVLADARTGARRCVVELAEPFPPFYFQWTPCGTRLIFLRCAAAAAAAAAAACMHAAARTCRRCMQARRR